MVMAELDSDSGNCGELPTQPDLRDRLIGSEQSGPRICRQEYVFVTHPGSRPRFSAPLAHSHSMPEAAAADEVNLVVVVDDVLHEAAGKLLVLRRIRIDGPAQFLGHKAEAGALGVDDAEAHGPTEAVADFNVDGADWQRRDLRALAI